MASDRLSRSFRLSEFFRAGDPPPGPGDRSEYRHLCRRYLQPLRDRFGRVDVASGRRTAVRNRQVGGAPLSYHLDVAGRPGVAADVVCATGTPREWYAFLDRLQVPGLGLYDDHVHVDNRRGRARW